MPAPSVARHLEGLIGRDIQTVSGRANRILSVADDAVLVGTMSSPTGKRVPLGLIQSAADRVWGGEEFEIAPSSAGYRSAFVGAVLQSMPRVEILRRPQRARLRPEPAPGQINPAWQFDELILALALYLRWRPTQPPAGHPDLLDLSETLRRLPIHPLEARAESFRNINSVRRKLGDFAAPDPNYVGKGTKGGEGVHLVWAEFADAPEALSTAVERIRASVDAPPLPPPDESEAQAVEGRILVREHRIRERDPGLIRKRKTLAMTAHGRLACEVCDIDFSECYGRLGEGFMEAHHTLPLAVGAVRVTKVEDLALLCANCHRMIHRARPMLTVQQLREALQTSSEARGGGVNDLVPGPGGGRGTLT